MFHVLLKLPARAVAVFLNPPKQAAWKLSKDQLGV